LPLAAVRQGGNVASTLNAADDQAVADYGLRGNNVMARPVRELLVALAEQVTSGTLKAEVRSVLSLDQAAAGLATIAGGKSTGKIVVAVRDCLAAAAAPGSDQGAGSKLARTRVHMLP